MKLAVIIPCYRVKFKILKLIHECINLFDYVIVVDDCCPQKSGKYVLENIKNKKLKIIFNYENLGVGGAIKKGIKYLENKNFDIITKLDGDGQIKSIDAYKISEILYYSNYEYANGNRFIFKTKNIPLSRWYLNKLITMYGKICLGKYEINDYLNGLISLKKRSIKKINFNNVRNDFFFESDLIYQSRINKLKVMSYPIKIKYFKEKSNFRPIKEFWKFFILYIDRFFKRILRNYFIKSFYFPSIIIIVIIVYNVYFLSTLTEKDIPLIVVGNLFMIIIFFLSDYFNNKNEN
jgi:dolichol-phosphate mannosyltransferase